MKRNGLAIAALVAAFLLSGPARAEVFSAEGVAPLDNGLVAARDMALRDALKLIAIRQGARVESAQVLENGRASESGTLTASGAVQGTVKVVSEYQQGKLYHVKVQVDAGDPAAAAPRPATPPARCRRAVRCGASW